MYTVEEKNVLKHKICYMFNASLVVVDINTLPVHDTEECLECAVVWLCVEVKVSSVNVSSVLSDHKSKQEAKECNNKTKLISAAGLSLSPSHFTSPELVLLATLSGVVGIQ